MAVFGNISSSLKQVIPANVAWEFRVLPIALNDDLLTVVTDNADAKEAIIARLSVVTGYDIAVQQADKADLEHGLATNYLRKQNNQHQKTLNVDSEDFIHQLIKESHELGCSDIHIESYRERCRIRMRLDGKLVERYELQKQRYSEYINRIKIISNLDIAEKRLPQDGRILIKDKQYQYDIRVSVLPTLFGEKVVLRLLSSDASRLDIKDLGFDAKQLAAFEQGINKPQGLVIISGPTGSGKTTTLYGALKTLNKNVSNILTIEDPIEYTLEGVNQVQLNEKVGLGFAATLKSFLRQDPDIIMVGEIRDVDTAQMAIRAAMTGHLVMSTVHTNSAFGIVSRLIEMGIPAYLLADTLNVALAQRLVRCLCPNCKETTNDLKVLPERIRSTGLTQYYTPKGCASCHYTGYKGRKAIYEIITSNVEVRKHILSGGVEWDDSEIVTLADSAIQLFVSGETSLEEIYTYLI